MEFILVCKSILLSSSAENGSGIDHYAARIGIMM